MSGVSLETLSKQFGETRALDGVTLDIADREFVVLLGASDCGKTTLLRLIAGLEIADGGTVKLGDRLVSRPGWASPPADRNVGMVFEDYALWPHMSVADNVGFPLRMRKATESERVRRVEEALVKLGLEALAARRPQKLSGGERQRVALARCLAMRPEVVLLDEPLAGLDAPLRDTALQSFASFHQDVAATIIYATRDPAEALSVATRVAIMEAGRIEQVAAPRELYAEPKTEMIARLVGRGMVVPATVIGRTSERLVVDVWGLRVPVRGAGQSGERRSLCVRTENLALASNGHGIRCRVTGIGYHGAGSLVIVRPDAEESQELKIEYIGSPPERGAEVMIEMRDGWIIPQAIAPAE